MGIKEDYLKALENDNRFNNGSFEDKMSVLAKDKGYPIGINPTSDMIGGFERYHNVDPVVEQKFGFDPKVVETSYDAGYNPNATYGIPAQAGVPSALERKLPTVQTHGFLQDAQEWIQDPVHMGIAGAGALGSGLLGYGAYRAFRPRKKTASWVDSFSDGEIVKIANNVDRVVADYEKNKAKNNSGEGTHSEQKANKYFNLNNESRKKYEEMKANRDSAYSKLKNVNDSVNAFNKTKNEKDRKYLSDVIYNSTGSRKADIALKKNIFGKTTRFGMSPGIVNKIK